MKECNKPGTYCDCKMDTCILEEKKRITSHVTITMHTDERCVQTYFPKVVKSFRTVAAQTGKNIPINIVNPEDMNILEMDHMEDHNYSIGPRSKYM